MTTSLGLLLDPSTVERHNMANGFGSGLPVSGQVVPSSRESSPTGSRIAKRHSAEFHFDDGNVVFLVRTSRMRGRMLAHWIVRSNEPCTKSTNRF